MRHQTVSRRSWILKSGSVFGAMAIARSVFAQPATQPSARPSAAKFQKGPPLDQSLVQEFVRAGHTDLDGVRDMLAAHPTLINGTWDWGGGDFETALGGASHMGRPDIADFLLAHNARLDIFAAAMLGRLEIVKAACEAFPNTPKVPGPHGIPLIEHARKGGDPSRAVLEYLESLK